MGRRALVLVLAAALLAGCGGGYRSTRSSAQPATTAAPVSTAYPVTTVAAAHSAAKLSASTSASPPPLQGEAASAATGDIPDNQVFLVFRNHTGGYAMKYPEGWAQQGNGTRVTFRDKNNIVRIVVGHGAPATAAAVRRNVAAQGGLKLAKPPQQITVSGARAVKVVYTTRSAPNPVTGKRVVLTVDRYYLSHAGRTAVVDLGTPVGVDNVDAYRLMIESFRWR